MTFVLCGVGQVPKGLVCGNIIGDRGVCGGVVCAQCAANDRSSVSGPCFSGDVGGERGEFGSVGAVVGKACVLVVAE